MRAAMERREAPGLLARARAPRDPHPLQNLGPGSLACGRVSQTRHREVSQTSWAPPGAPSLYGREKENRETAAAGRPKNNPRHSGALPESLSQKKSPKAASRMTP